jgi:putative phosphotransacetylase
MRTFQVPVGVSNRHLHLSENDIRALFGEGHSLTFKKAPSQPGQFASEETVTLIGPKGSIPSVRVLGPSRPSPKSN